MTREIELLTVVKSYPNPSRSLGESVCVVGISKELGLVRLYPIPFRDLADDQKFSKYQLIRLQVRDPRQDKRPNTFRPVLDSLQVIGDPIPPADNWHDRKEWVMPLISESMCSIQAQQEESGVSMGVFKPAEIIDLKQEEDERKEWTPAEITKLSQTDMFLTRDKKILDKIPYKWSYRYRCSDASCGGHEQQIIDWELGQLYRNLIRAGMTDAGDIHREVKRKYLMEICGPDKDVYFFTGNMAKRHHNFLILGVFWPKKEDQLRLL